MIALVVVLVVMIDSSGLNNEVSAKFTLHIAVELARHMLHFDLHFLNLLKLHLTGKPTDTLSCVLVPQLEIKSRGS
jgi:hypothetical protein